MNLVWLSPDVPQVNVSFVEHLSRAGVRVVAVGDAPYEGLDPRLHEHLAEYYAVKDLNDDDDVLRALAFFIFRDGRIDRLETNNEHWLPLVTRLREDFNIPGLRPGTPVTNSEALAAAAAAGVPVAESGAVRGTLVSWDALINAKGETVFEGATRWPSEVNGDYTYRTLPEVPARVRDMGIAVAQACGWVDTLVHVQVDLAATAADRSIAPARVVRAIPAGPPAFTIDMHNYARHTDLYASFADVVLTGTSQRTPEISEPRSCWYASRWDGESYAVSSWELEESWGESLPLVARNPIQYSGGMGDSFYLMCSSDEAAGERFTHEVIARAEG